MKPNFLPRGWNPRNSVSVKSRQAQEKQRANDTDGYVLAAQSGQVAGAATEKHGLEAHRPKRPAHTAFSQESPCPDHRNYATTTRLPVNAFSCPESSDITGAYQVFHNVTELVRRAGSGVYTVADVQSGTGEDRYAGWSLIVAYEAPADPPRNLTVFDGLQSVTLGKPGVTIPISGFQTPLSGPGRTRLGFVAYEGDFGYTGDSAALNGRLLTDTLNPQKNFFNSGISIDGRPFAAKSPDYLNQLGFDAKLIGIDGILANGATSADIALRTTSEQYLPGAITFATDLYAPIIRVEKGVSDLTHPGGPAEPGDVLRYAVKFANDGQEAATNFLAEDSIPAGTTYLPDTLKIAGEAASPTDVVRDDLGEYHAARHGVRFFLRAGASPGRGGALAARGVAGSDASISFDLRVAPSPPELTEITNVAQATFVAPTLGKELSALSPPVRIGLTHPRRMVPEADLDLSQAETLAPTPDGGADVTDVITVEDRGPSDATDVVVHDTLPPDAVVDSATTNAGSCTVNPTEVTCTIPRVDDLGSAEIDVVEHVPALDARDGAINDVVATAAQLDQHPANNSGDQAAAPTSGPPPTSRQRRSPCPRAVQQGNCSPRWGRGDTITVRNVGPDEATGMHLEDALSADAELIGLRPDTAQCANGLPLRCSLTDLPSGATATVKLSLRPLRPGKLVDTVSIDRRGHSRGRLRQQLCEDRRGRPRGARLGPDPPDRHAADRAPRAARADSDRHCRERVTPGVGSVLCVRLRAGLQVRSASAAEVVGSRVCWIVGELVPGRPQSFQLTAKVLTATPGARLVSVARLSGRNFTTRNARATVEAPPPFVGCTASVSHSEPRARIAC